MSRALAPAREWAAIEQAASLVLDGVPSDNTRRAYGRALRDFLAWLRAEGRRFNRAAVHAYLRGLKTQGVSGSSIQQRLIAIRQLAREAEANGVLDPALATGIRTVRGMPQRGHKLGQWLTKPQAQALLYAPDTATLKGLRDRAILALLLGCGLRRAEAVSLTLEQIQQREGRWVIVDLLGKRNKTRSVPMPAWAKAALDAWTQAAGVETGLAFWSFFRGQKIREHSLTPQALYDLVQLYSIKAGLPALAAHDLRRTFAKLAQKGGAGLDQIQLSLGHESLKTTQIYLGLEQDLTDAPCDHLGLRL